METFSHVYFEIAGVCNGGCPYCVTGSKKTENGKFIDVDLFYKAVHRLLDTGLIKQDACFHLYNWGEPFLHPNLRGILKVLNDLNLRYALSTNASVLPDIDENFVKNLHYLRFSMSGFSQKSYDKIHKFNIEKIKKNIAFITEKTRESGFKGNIGVSFHVYQFNLDEIVKCELFTKELGIDIYPHNAFLNDYWAVTGYVNNSLPYEELKNISQDLLCHFMTKKIGESPQNYCCPQHDILTLDECANVITCCLLPKNHPDYLCGNIIDGDVGEILKERLSKKECASCVNSGIAYLVHNGEKIYPGICGE